jgi:hypothetical protein
MNYITSLPTELEALIYTKLRNTYDIENYLRAIEITDEFIRICNKILCYYDPSNMDMTSHPLVIKLIRLITERLSKAKSFSVVAMDWDDDFIIRIEYKDLKCVYYETSTIIDIDFNIKPWNRKDGKIIFNLYDDICLYIDNILSTNICHL